MIQSQRNAMNRKNGEDFERKIVARFKKRSDVLYVQRGSGSFGVWDIMVQFLNGTVLYVSAKLNGYHDMSERVKIKKFIRKVVAKRVKNVRMEMHYYKTARKVALIHLKTEADVERLEVTRRELV